MNDAKDRFHVRRTLGAYLVVDRALEAELADVGNYDASPEVIERAEGLGIEVKVAAALAGSYPFSEDGVAAKAQAVGHAAALNLAEASAAKPEPPVEPPTENGEAPAEAESPPLEVEPELEPVAPPEEG